MFQDHLSSTSNANTCIESGIYNVGSNWSNVPVNWAVLLVFKIENANNSYVLQILKSTVASDNRLWVRTSDSNGTNWAEWRYVVLELQTA